MAATNPSHPAEERTYGNWRRPEAAGIGPLGMIGTFTLMGGAILAVILMVLAGGIAGLVMLAVTVVALVPMSLKDTYERTLMQRATARMAWRRGRRQGQHIYRSGLLGISAHGTCRLPGIAAASQMSEATDSYGRAFGLISLPTANHYTVVLNCGAEGASLVDAAQVDTWVAYWGAWLAGLAHEPFLVAAQVSVESAPDPGTRLAAEVRGQIDPEAPTLARQVLEEIVATYPSGSARMAVRIALTYSSLRPGAKTLTRDEMATEIGSRLPGLTSRLAMAGAGDAQPMTALELSEMVRTAFDPSVEQLVEQARLNGGSGVTWSDAGPVAAEEAWDHYRHDSACSVTWGMADAPRGVVHSGVLAQLLSPHRDIARKRVTLIYRPHNPISAQKIVERDKRDAASRVGSPKDASRDSEALLATKQTADEEARGAGVLRFSMLVTATVSSSEDLPKAIAAIDVLAAPARVRLRRMYGSQATAFTASLPIGIVLPDHVRVPTAVRERM